MELQHILVIIGLLVFVVGFTLYLIRPRAKLYATPETAKGGDVSRGQQILEQGIDFANLTTRQEQDLVAYAVESVTTPQRQDLLTKAITTALGNAHTSLVLT